MSESGPPRQPGGILGLAFTSGLTILAGMFIGFYGGRYLDRLLGWEPWLSLAGILLGAVAGFRVLLRDILGSSAPTGNRRSATEDRLEEGSDEPKRD